MIGASAWLILVFMLFVALASGPTPTSADRLFGYWPKAYRPGRPVGVRLAGRLAKMHAFSLLIVLVGLISSQAMCAGIGYGVSSVESTALGSGNGTAHR